MAVVSAPRHQLGGPAAFGNPALPENQNFVHRLQPDRLVGDYQQGSAGRRGDDVPHQFFGGLIVQIGGWLVEDDDGKVGEESAGDCDALPLAAGHLDPRLADRSIQTGR